MGSQHSQQEVAPHVRNAQNKHQNSHSGTQPESHSASRQGHTKSSNKRRYGTKNLGSDYDVVLGVDPNDPYDIFPQPKDAYGNGFSEGEGEEEEEYETCCEACARQFSTIAVVLAFLLGLLIAVLGLCINLSEGFDFNAKLAATTCQSDLRWSLYVMMAIGKLTMLSCCFGGCGLKFENIILLMVFAILMVLLGLSLVVMAYLLGSEIDQVWAPVTRAANYICQDPERTKAESQKYGLVCNTSLLEKTTSMSPSLAITETADSLASVSTQPKKAPTAPAESSTQKVSDKKPQSSSLVKGAPVCLHQSALGASSSEVARDDFMQSLDENGCSLVDRLCESTWAFNAETSCVCGWPTSFYVPLGQKRGTYCSAWDSFEGDESRWCFVVDGVTCGNIAGPLGSRRSDGPCGPGVESRSAMSADDFTYLSLYHYLAWFAAAVLIVSAVAFFAEAATLWFSHRERASTLLIQDSPKSGREGARSTQPYLKLSQNPGDSDVE